MANPPGAKWCPSDDHSHIDGGSLEKLKAKLISSPQADSILSIGVAFREHEIQATFLFGSSG
jgi:hypothetical protein